MIYDLSPRERILQDTEAVASLYRELGSLSAEKVVTQTLAELATVITALVLRVRCHDLQGLPNRLQRLEDLADHLGLISLGLVAADAKRCLNRNDSTAFAAVWARLMRVSEQILAEKGGFAGHSL